MQNCYFNIRNVTKKQAIGIPMGIDQAPFWVNIFLYFYKEEYISLVTSSDKIKERCFHSVKRFIDNLCAINDDRELGMSICDIYPKELELKFKNQGDKI